MEKEEYHLEIDSDPNNLITVEEFFNYVAAEVKVDEKRLSGLLIAITEACTNAIIHANKKDVNKKVIIDCETLDDKLYIKIKDEGAGFDPTKIPDPTEPENLLKDSGRGLYLMKIYSDDLRYNITPHGTETILVVNLK